MEKKKDHFPIIAKTFAGLEQALENELKLLGAEKTEIIRRGVKCHGNLRFLYKANLNCRTALKFLVPLFDFKAGNEEELYKHVLEFEWEKYLTTEKTFSIDAVTSYSNLTHSRYTALKTKDAIADRFRKLRGRRPSVDTDDPDLRLNVRVFRDECNISLDSTGVSLHKRGYRRDTGPAPVNEVLAAGMVMLSGWDGQTPLIDPMCGSGTIPIEAAMYALGIPPGSLRNEFAFMRWNKFDKTLWEDVKKESSGKSAKRQPTILGNDMSGSMIAIARRNAMNAGLKNVIELKTGYFDSLKPPGEKGMLIMNPPYGERMHKSDIIRFYKEIGDTLKKNFTGHDAWILSADIDALRFVGLRPARKIQLYNGKLECRFAKFEIYEGSKKSKK